MSSPHWQITKQKQAVRAAGIIIPLGAWGFFLFKNFHQLQNHKWEISLLGLTGSLFFGTLYFLLLSLRWALLLQNMAKSKNTSRVPIAQAMQVWLTTIMSRYVPGNVWHVVSRMAFADRLNVSKLQIFSATTVEQILAVICAMLVSAVSFPFWPLAASGQQWLPNMTLFIIVLVIGLTILHPHILGFILRLIAKKLNKHELDWQVTYGTIIFFVFIFSLAALIAGLALAVLLAGLNDSKSLNVIYIIGSSSFAWVVGYLSFITPSGLGVREGVLTALLSLMYPLPLAIVASLLFRFILTLSEFIAIILFLTITRVIYPGRI